MNELSRRRLLQAAIASAFCGTWTGISAAEDNAKLATARVTLEGYDPVAYFTDGHPVKGSPAFSFPFDDSVCYFASAEHQQMFAADPDRYAPQYSGYCAAGIRIAVSLALMASSSAPLANSARMPSPAVSMMRPPDSATIGSTTA